MDNNFSFEIPKVFNVFTPNKLSEIVKIYHLDKYYHLNQIHSNIINIISSSSPTNITGDALITNNVNTPLVIKTADCIPIVLYDQVNNVLAAIHSGWRGTVNSIVTDTVNMMTSKFNSNPSDIEAYLYPSIRKCHFEVDSDVYLIFKPKYSKFITKKNNKYYIDLQGIIKSNLKSSGITKISDSNICTYCNHDKYYSYRFNKTNNRNYLITYIEE